MGAGHKARLLLLGGLAVLTPRVYAARAADPQPAVRIPVAPLGFLPPSKFYQPFRMASASLGFLDPTHLLLTFHHSILMKRIPGDPQEDEDQIIKAVVLSLPSGKVDATADWRLHDRGSYLWMLRDGHFLLRIRDTLYIGGKSLTLKPYLEPEGKLVSVQISPDTATLTAQYSNPLPASEEGDNTATKAPTLGPDAPRLSTEPRQYTILIVNTATRTAARVAHLSSAVVLPMVQGGYLGTEQDKGKLWRISLIPFTGGQQQIATVESTCQPTLQALSEKAFLASSCLAFSSSRVVDAFDVSGRKLWEQVWQSRFTWGTFAYSDAGRRFAYGSIEVNHDLAPLDPVDMSSILGQPVGVFNIQTGKSSLVVDAEPILTAGQNFALSPSGDRLAILRDGAVEVFKLPPVVETAAKRR